MSGHFGTNHLHAWYDAISRHTSRLYKHSRNTSIRRGFPRPPGERRLWRRLRGAPIGAPAVPSEQSTAFGSGEKKNCVEGRYLKFKWF